MKSIKTVHLIAVFIFIVLLFTVDYGFTFPTSWWVNGNGYTGYLTYRINPSNNRVKGKLLNTPVNGYPFGRHIVLHRYP